MDASEVIALKKSREEEFRKDMDAIERVLRMLGQSSEINGTTFPITSPEEAQITAATALSRGASWKVSPTNAIRHAIALVPDQFTIKEVRKALSDKWPTVPQTAAVLSPALRRISEEGKIEVVTKGSGSAPTVYRKAKTAPIRFQRSAALSQEDTI